MGEQRSNSDDLSCSKIVSLKSHTQSKVVSPNQGGPITKKIKYSEMSESDQRISTSDGNDDRTTRIGDDETILIWGITRQSHFL